MLSISDRYAAAHIVAANQPAAFRNPGEQSNSADAESLPPNCRTSFRPNHLEKYCDHGNSPALREFAHNEQLPPYATCDTSTHAVQCGDSVRRTPLRKPTTRINHRRLVASRLVAPKQLPPPWSRGCFSTRPSSLLLYKLPRPFLLHLNSVPPIGSEEWCPSVHGTHVGKQPSADTNELSSRPNSNHEECGV